MPETMGTGSIAAIRIRFCIRYRAWCSPVPLGTGPIAAGTGCGITWSPYLVPHRCYRAPAPYRVSWLRGVRTVRIGGADNAMVALSSTAVVCRDPLGVGPWFQVVVWGRPVRWRSHRPANRWIDSRVNIGPVFSREIGAGNSAWMVASSLTRWRDTSRNSATSA